MSDWFKFDPFAKSGGGGGSGAMGGFRTGIQLYQFFVKTRRAEAERKRMEEDRKAERQRQEDLLRNPPPVHGSARWATPAELGYAKLLHPEDKFGSPSSILLGSFLDDANNVRGQIHWDGEGHLLTVAPTRSGKSTTTIVPNLVRYQGSCVVLDPKGELFAQTAAWRAKNVGPVYRIAPFADTTHGFNPLATINTFSDARALADLLIPADPKSSDFFKSDAVAFLSGLILHIIKSAPEKYRTMAEIRRVTALPMDKFRRVAADMARSPIAAVANAANIVLGKSDKGLPGLRDTLSSALAIWDDAEIMTATSSADVDFKALKDTPATVYISIPFDKMSAYAPFLQVLLTTALEAMVQNQRQPDIPVLFVLDEFLSLGPFPRFRDAIRTHAGAGVRLWFFLQDVPTLEEHYPQSWKTFFNAAVKTFFGTNEGFTGELISKHFLGDKTEAHFSGGLSTQRSAEKDGSANISESITLTGRPLLKQDEVIQLLSNPKSDGTRYGIAAIGSARIKMLMVPWFHGNQCRERVTAAQK